MHSETGQMFLSPDSCNDVLLSFGNLFWKAENCLKRLVTGVAPAALCTDLKAVSPNRVVQPLRLT